MSRTGLTRLLTRPLNVELNTLLDVRPGFASSSAAQFLADYSTDGQGFVMTFARQNGKGPSSKIVDTGTPANDNDLTLFSNFAEFNSVLTLTAPSPKITRQSDGDWKYQAHNKLQRSETFENAYWTKRAGVTATDNSVANPVSGLTTACLLDEGTGASQFHDIYVPAFTAATGVQQRVAVYGKDVDGQYLNIAFTASTAQYVSVIYDLSNGTVSDSKAEGTGFSVNTTAIEPVGDGWYKCSMVCTLGAASGINFSLSNTGTIGSGNFGLITYTGTGRQIYIWAGHYHNYPADETYMATEGSPVFALPIHHDASGNELGLKVEPAATNLLTYSILDTTSYYTVSGGVTVTENDAAGPTGEITASRIVATGGSHSIFRTVTVTAETDYVFSFYAKNNGGTEVKYRVYDGSNAADIIAQTSYFSQLNDSTYVRVEIPFTTPAGCTSVSVYPSSNAATSAEDLHVDLLQLELGSVATSPIITAGSTVTRAKDQLSIATSAFPHDATEWTLYLEWQLDELESWFAPIALNDGTSSEQTAPYTDSNGIIAVSTRDGNVEQGILAPGSVAASVSNKWVGAFAANDIASSRNGGTVVTDSSATLPTVTTLEIGSRSGGSNTINGLIKSIAYIPERVSNTNLQAMTD